VDEMSGRDQHERDEMARGGADVVDDAPTGSGLSGAGGGYGTPSGAESGTPAEPEQPPENASAGQSEWLRRAEPEPGAAADDDVDAETGPAGDENIREGRVGGVMGGPRQSQGQGQGG
jgi:hypothetical protein